MVIPEILPQPTAPEDSRNQHDFYGAIAQDTFKDIWTVRINDEFSKPEMATDLLEHNLKKLDMLYQRGSESFANHEVELRKMMESASRRLKVEAINDGHSDRAT